MAIDPQAAAALLALTRTDLPPPHRRTPAQARRAVAGYAALQGAAEPVARAVDVAGPVPLRVVRHRMRASPGAGSADEATGQRA